MKNLKLSVLNCMFLLLLSYNSKADVPPKPIAPLPRPQQVEWQKMETIAFLHFGPNTFNDKEWGYGDADPKTFNPTNLDCEQWVRTLKNAGFKEAIITAKHHDGFCLWPTHLTDYCIRNSPYKNGKGDIVGELAAACKKYGIKFGIYLSPWDRHQATYGKQEYLDYYCKEMTELLTRYGKVSEIWLDGANGGDGWYGGSKEVRKIDLKNYYNFPRIFKLIRKLQPDAIIFSDGGPDCRYMGNERGVAGITNWSFLRSKDVYPGYSKGYELNMGHPDGDTWTPGECDFSIRPGWFYHSSDDDKVKTAENLVELYYQNVGHNGLMLLNLPPDKRGLISPIDSLNVLKFHRQITKELKVNLFAGLKPIVSDCRGIHYKATNMTDNSYNSYWATKDDVKQATVVFNFSKQTKLNRIVLQEYVPLGQRVKSFLVEYFADNKWNRVNAHEQTTTIGFKRIVRFETITTKSIRIRFIDARGCLCINNIAAYYSGNDKSFTFSQEDLYYTNSYPFDIINISKAESEKVKDKNPKTIARIPGNEVIIDLGKIEKVRQIKLLPDQNEKAPQGLIMNYELYSVGGDNVNDASKKVLISTGEFSNIRNNLIWQSFGCVTIKTRFLILKATRMVNDSKAIDISELRIQ